MLLKHRAIFVLQPKFSSFKGSDCDERVVCWAAAGIPMYWQLTVHMDRQRCPFVMRQHMRHEAVQEPTQVWVSSRVLADSNEGRT